MKYQVVSWKTRASSSSLASLDFFPSRRTTNLRRTVARKFAFYGIRKTSIFFCIHIILHSLWMSWQHYCIFFFPLLHPFFFLRVLAAIIFIFRHHRQPDKKTEKGRRINGNVDFYPWLESRECSTYIEAHTYTAILQEKRKSVEVKRKRGTRQWLSNRHDEKYPSFQRTTNGPSVCMP